jgi:Protein of unknown function (DUF3429)
MNQGAIGVAKSLTYAGTLPFIACAMGVIIPSAGADGRAIVMNYGAVIISFLCGIHWACYLFFAERCPRNLLLTSNIVALLACLSLLVHANPLALLLQTLCFLYLLVLDYKLCEVGILSPWFYTLRRNATVIVVVSLSIIMEKL